MAKKAKNINEGMDKAVELTQDAAKATIKGAIQTAEVSEDYIQSIYKAGYEANLDALKVAKGYWDASTEIRKDWVNFFAETSESIVENGVSVKVPYQKDAIKFGKGLFDRVTGTFQGFIPRT